MVFGVNWIFERDRFGDYQAGYCNPPADWPLAWSVAASSCFPPVFPPLPLGLPASSFQGGDWQGQDRQQLIGQISLCDGGVYDNLGLEPVWKDYATILVSDGGAPFDYQVASTPLSRLFRYTAIIQNQAIALRKRWLISDLTTGLLTGTYWGVASSPSSYDSQARGYSKDLAINVIGTIRTDLNPFTAAEMDVLENHGYLLTDAALSCHVKPLYNAAALCGFLILNGWMKAKCGRPSRRAASASPGGVGLLPGAATVSPPLGGQSWEKGATPLPRLDTILSPFRGTSFHDL